MRYTTGTLLPYFKYQTPVEMLGMDKHSSLLRLLFNHVGSKLECLTLASFSSLAGKSRTYPRVEHMRDALFA
jgi:hypothetical protein